MCVYAYMEIERTSFASSAALASAALSAAARARKRSSKRGSSAAAKAARILSSSDCVYMQTSEKGPGRASHRGRWRRRERKEGLGREGAMHRGRLPLITYALSHVCLAQHTFMVCRSALCERHASSSVLPSFARLPSLLRAAPQKSTKASTSASSTGASPRSAAANEAARATSCGLWTGRGEGLSVSAVGQAGHSKSDTRASLGPHGALDFLPGPRLRRHPGGFLPRSLSPPFPSGSGGATRTRTQARTRTPALGRLIRLRQV